MGLILPAYLAGNERPRSTIFGHYISLSCIAGGEPQLSDFVQRLAKLKRDDVIRQVVYLLEVLDQHQRDVFELQTNLVPHYLTAERQSQLSTYLKDQPGGTIFHKQALWFVLQFAALACSEDIDSLEEPELRRELGDCLLLANDFLEDAEWPEDVSGDDAKIDDAITAVLLPIREIGIAHQNLLELSRFKTLWLDLPRTERFETRMRDLSVGTDWHNVFEAKYEVDLNHFATICAICVSFFLPDESNPTAKRMDLGSYFGNGKFRQIADSVLKHITQTPDEFARTLINRPRQSWSRDFTSLKKRPLLWAAGGHLTCPQLSFLIELLRDGIYWHLFDAYKEDGGRFQECFGYAFELYVEDQLSSIAHPGDLLVRELYTSPKFQGTTDEVCDFFIDWNNATVVAECKASLLTSRQKYSGDHDALLKGIDDQFAGRKKGVTQLALSINRLLRGEKPFAAGRDISPDVGKPIVPVLITYEPAVGFHSVQRRLQRKFQESLSVETIESGCVLPVVVLTIDNLEILQGLDNAAPARQILLQYAHHLKETTADRLGSFNDFLWNHYPNARVANDSNVRLEAQQLMRQVEENFRRAAEQEQTG
jgi:hypothetical protein